MVILTQIHFRNCFSLCACVLLFFFFLYIYNEVSKTNLTLKYRSLVTDLSNDYHSIECLDIFGQSSESFLEMCTELGFDNRHLQFTISKLLLLFARGVSDIRQAG